MKTSNMRRTCTYMFQNDPRGNDFNSTVVLFIFSQTHVSILFLVPCHVVYTCCDCIPNPRYTPNPIILAMHAIPSIHPTPLSGILPTHTQNGMYSKANYRTNDVNKVSVLLHEASVKAKLNTSRAGHVTAHPFVHLPVLSHTPFPPPPSSGSLQSFSVQ
ncbi:hypothetical protein BGZ63DRAFT_74983 [Mariannaea sp. PMI_226]|nr:hypothetical protein BGZ63DRAFT_74983 [Mariannaea sp. PMI_226]